MRGDTLMNRWSLCCTPAGQQPFRAEEGDGGGPEESEGGREGAHRQP